MVKVKFKGFGKAHPLGDRYSGSTGTWAAGDVRSVEDAVAIRLCADFPRVFVQLSGKAETSAKALQAKLDAATARIAELEGEVNAAAADVEVLEGKLDAAAARVAELEADAAKVAPAPAEEPA